MAMRKFIRSAYEFGKRAGKAVAKLLNDTDGLFAILQSIQF